MAYEMKPESGSLFKNDQKQTEKHPDDSGSALINGVEYWMNAWIKRPQGKKPYMSFSFKVKGAPKTAAAPPQAPEPAPPPEPAPDFDDEIPF